MTEERGSLRPLTDAIGGLLSNPVVIEGLIAGISAISASRKTKASGNEGTSQSGGLLDVLPGVLPLLSILTPSASAEAAPVLSDGENDPPPSPFSDAEDVDIAGADDSPEENISDGAAPASVFPDMNGGGNVSVSYESRESQRENLLLAIRPFLSESRRSAADAMVQVNKLSGLFRRG